jgi:hypothetical protein
MGSVSHMRFVFKVYLALRATQPERALRDETGRCFPALRDYVDKVRGTSYLPRQQHRGSGPEAEVTRPWKPSATATFRASEQKTPKSLPKPMAGSTMRGAVEQGQIAPAAGGFA